MIGLALLAAATIDQAPASTPSGWTPRQANIIRRANAVTASDSRALLNACLVLNGRERYDATARRLTELHPRLVRELGEYPVYEIFVVRAPQVNPAAVPPARCRPRRNYAPDREALMNRFEQAVAALAATLDEAS